MMTLLFACGRRAALCAGLLLAATSLVRADTLTRAWAIAPDERLYVGTANLERGLGVNPASGNVLLLSRAGGAKVYVLSPGDGSDGSEATGEPRVLSLVDETGESPVAGGTFALNLVGAADDGAVYACNLATSLGTVRLYRWANDGTDTPVSVAFAGDPLEGISEPGSGQDIRFGDNLAVRGSGAGTQLLQTSRNGRYAVLYTTVDGVSFTPTVFTTPGLQGKAGLGLAFGSGDTFWAKVNGAGLVRAGFSIATRQVQILNEVSTSVVGANITGLGVDAQAGLLAGVDYAGHTLSLFDITDPAAPIRLGEPLAFPTANPNVNGTGAAAVRGTNVFALDSNNGVLGARLERSVVAEPPVITTQPASVAVYAGATVVLSVAAQGTAPIAYQWVFNDSTLLTGATSAQLALTNVGAAQAGSYSVVVSNAAAVVTSAKATLTVREPLNTGVLQPLWSLNTGDRPYLTTDNAQRGLAYNPATGNLLLATRTPANSIVVLDAASGAEKHRLRATTADELPLFSGGTLVLNQVAVSEDGVVYAGNLVTDGSAAAFRLYRWPNDTAESVPEPLLDIPELAIAERWGDTMDIRGSGAGTQILLGARGLAPQEGRKFAVLTTPDGFAFTARVFTVPDAAPAAFGLGIAFGPGNSVFGTASGQPLVHASFNLADGTAALARTYDTARVPAALGFIGSLPSSNLLVGVALETPDNVQAFDLANLDEPVLLDQELILPEFPNANGTGAVDLGGDRVFVLDTNHGLRAYRRSAVQAPPALSIASGAAGIRITYEGVLQSSASVTGPWADVAGASSPYTPPNLGAAGFFRARR